MMKIADEMFENLHYYKDKERSTKKRTVYYNCQWAKRISVVRDVFGIHFRKYDTSEYPCFDDDEIIACAQLIREMREQETDSECDDEALRELGYKPVSPMLYRKRRASGSCFEIDLSDKNDIQKYYYGIWGKTRYDFTPEELTACMKLIKGNT